MTNWTENKNFDATLKERMLWRSVLSPEGMRAARDEITGWPDYHRTPLVRLDRLATELDVGEICYKDESSRFGLGSFKALGGAYAVKQVVAQSGGVPQTVVCATDGNHGRSVAWGARMFGASAVILIHRTVSEARKRAIEQFGAKVIRVEGNYDDSVRDAKRLADEFGWTVVSDTSYEGYEDIPRQVMLGYTLMAYEAVSEMTQAGLRPSHVFLQCGVGGMAAAVIAQIAEQLASDLPRFVAVEPENADCVMVSLREGTPIPAAGDLDTVMAGLSCGEVSILAWRILATALSAAMTVPETLVPEAMRSLADRAWAATPVVAGESAVAGVCGAIIAARDADMRAALDLNPDSRILVFGTEGATDPAFYAQTVGRTAAEVSLSGD